MFRVLGGSAGGDWVAALGFATTLLSIGLALVPAIDEPNKVLAVVKVAGLTLALLAAGALVYILGKRRRA